MVATTESALQLLGQYTHLLPVSGTSPPSDPPHALQPPPAKTEENKTTYSSPHLSYRALKAGPVALWVVTASCEDNAAFPLSHIPSPPGCPHLISFRQHHHCCSGGVQPPRHLCGRHPLNTVDTRLMPAGITSPPHHHPTSVCALLDVCHYFAELHKQHMQCHASKNIGSALGMSGW
jgi:hypothetical protein